MSKAIVWFKDGNIRTFYSNDKSYSRGIVKMQIGVNRLIKMILKWKDKIETAIIYNNINGSEITKFKDGKKIK